jgi:hypothetical protein
MFRICEYFMLSWVGFCLLVVQSVNARDQTGLTVMMYLLLPVIAYLGHLLAEVRKRQMMEVDANILTSPLEFELKGRLLMEPIMVTMQDKFTGRSPEKTALTAEQVELNEDKLTRLLQGTFCFCHSPFPITVVKINIFVVVIQMWSHCTTWVALNSLLRPCSCYELNSTFTFIRWPSPRLTVQRLRIRPFRISTSRSTAMLVSTSCFPYST